MRRHFEEERHGGRGVMPHLCSYGRIVFHPQGLMATLQSVARVICDAGPPILSDQERWQFRYHAADFFCGTSQMLRTATMSEQLLS
jgi:hypothetical protein